MKRTREYLEYEIERLLDEQRRQREDAERDRQEQRRYWQEQDNYDRHYASSWPEALQKQEALCRNEATLWWRNKSNFEEWDGDDFFGSSADACQRALEIWKEVEASKQPQIKALERQIEAINDDIRSQVADKLETENDTKQSGWRNVVKALRENEDFNEWLWW